MSLKKILYRNIVNIPYFETLHSFTFIKFPNSIMFLVKLYDKF